MRLNVARVLPRSAANGPGDRFVVWVQGCPLACAGCWNQDTWAFERRNLRGVDSLAAEVLSTPGIEGVTFSGGEPFAQARALADLARRARKAGLSVCVFTGYELSELRSEDQRSLLALTDILVTGRYDQEKRTTNLPWRGSSNQSVLFLSSRYGPPSLEDAAAVEAHISRDGHITLTGFPVEAAWSTI
jgi:anaerobic ribonucleoside-triphosphate reductase activating protein